MGYSTSYAGTIAITPPLNPAEINYLTRFATTRRMSRKLGPYYADGTGHWGQGYDADIVNRNTPPADQPGLWCQWIPTDDGTGLRWDGNEKFYAGPDWMRYLIAHFLKAGAHAAGQPGFEGFTFDHVLDGTLQAQGELPDDQWELRVMANEVETSGAEQAA